MGAAARKPYLTLRFSTARREEAACAPESVNRPRNIVRRNQVCYAPQRGRLLIGGYGGGLH